VVFASPFSDGVPYVGAPSPSDRGKSSLQVRGVGFDGQPITMPLVKVRFIALLTLYQSGVYRGRDRREKENNVLYALQAKIHRQRETRRPHRIRD